VSIVAQAVVVAGAGWVVANPRLVSDAVTVHRFDPPLAISALATDADMSERGRFVFYASTPELVPAESFDLYCSRDEPGIGVLGCFTLADARIYLYDITDADLEPFEIVVAAHEMLHAAWDRLSSDEQSHLEAPLEEAFASLGPNHELVERIASYEEFDPTSRVPELYAILGTEISPLPEVLELHYSDYFVDRSVVVSIWRQIDAIFIDLETELERLSAELEALATQIDAERAATESDAAALEIDISAFNARAEQPGGYSSQSAFERDRDALLARQTALTARIDATNLLIDSYNAVVEEFTALNDQARALNRALNITPQPIESTG
jgi:Skp family chaperone for outer membrane proteins